MTMKKMMTRMRAPAILNKPRLFSGESRVIFVKTLAMTQRVIY